MRLCAGTSTTAPSSRRYSCNTHDCPEEPPRTALLPGITRREVSTDRLSANVLEHDGRWQELALEGVGHSPHLEAADVVRDALVEHIAAAEG
jgi:hypothetical protein